MCARWQLLLSQMFIRKFITAAVLLLLPIALCAAGTPADSTAAKKVIEIPAQYIPTFHGTFRAMYEHSTVGAGSRFLVRSARFSAQGRVLPIAEYYFQLDLCDRGKLKILDAYITVHPFKGFKVMAGQARVPFSVGATRAPHQYHFANRAMAMKYFGNLRNAGVKVAYTVPGTTLYAEGGAFNGSNMGDQTPWNRSLTYSVKANYTAGGWMPQIAFMSRLPGGDGVRINQGNASITYQDSRFYFEAEYIYRTYTGRSYKASHGYNVEADLAFPVHSKLINRLSVQARFDGITDASTGLRDADGLLTTDYLACNRATVGLTASYVKGKLHTDLRLNYEQYFYSHGRKALSDDDDNKLVAALVLYFCYTFIFTVYHY